MIFIAHRGLTNGPDSDRENTPQQIELSLTQGFHCEIDVRLVKDKWYLGHDQADYSIPFDFLIQPNLWIHAKNLDALDFLLTTDLNYFWHQEDDYTLTSHGIIWAYPGQRLSEKTVLVMPEMIDPNLNSIDWNCFAICSDWIDRLVSMYQRLD